MLELVALFMDLILQKKSKMFYRLKLKLFKLKVLKRRSIGYMLNILQKRFYNCYISNRLCRWASRKYDGFAFYKKKK